MSTALIEVATPETNQDQSQASKPSTGTGRWSLAQDKYIQLLSIPTKYRPPNLRTKEQIATALGVDTYTLTSWETTMGFWDDTFATARGIIGGKLADILESIAQEAIEGSVQAQKLALNVLGLAADRVDHRVQIEEDRLVVVLHATSADLAEIENGTYEPPRIVSAEAAAQAKATHDKAEALTIDGFSTHVTPGAVPLQNEKDWRPPIPPVAPEKLQFQHKQPKPPQPRPMIVVDPTDTDLLDVGDTQIFADLVEQRA